jgi:hypothetical protein
MIREFQRAYDQFAGHVPTLHDTVEWLSMMQHHGAPTRLRDFTYSAYVVAYFAVEEAEDNSVIWAVDGAWALQQAAVILQTASKKMTGTMFKPFMDEEEEGGCNPVHGKAVCCRCVANQSFQAK